MSANRLRTRLGISALAFGLLAAVPAPGAIVNAGAGPGVGPLGCAVSSWNWGIVPAAAEAGPNRCGPNWLIAPTSPAVAAGAVKNLSFDLQHLAPAPDAGEAAPNPAAPVSMNAGAYALGAPVAKAGALVIAHPGHHDVYSWQVVVPAAGAATISAKASHVRAAIPAGWSYDPAVLGGPAVINFVEASYPDGTTAAVPGVPAGKQAKKVGGALPPKPLPGGDTLPATDYRLRVTLGDPYFSDMTLAYVVGEPGSLAHGELGVMNEAFTGGAEYLVPMIFDSLGVDDLYIAVDLVQWLSFPSAYDLGNMLSIVDGTSDLLPGFLFSTSPIGFDATSGFTTSDPWTGTGVIFGEVDGHNVPVPAPMLLLLSTLPALLVLRRP
ncbi:MAG: hypothetical protein JNK67_32415 [Alphaproteobacteria bacterium]|nr:hypothetical protein [Alphaproteobacteria bacterium]